MKDVYCPKCNSKGIKKKAFLHWDYTCLSCGLNFNIKAEATQKPGHPEVVTLSGLPRCLDYTGPAPCPIDPSTGMHQDYWVLSEEERKKGFVKPVRQNYRHLMCLTITHMGRVLAETAARDPYFYSGTMCVNCGTHFPLDQFVWVNNDGTTGESMKP